jgi:Skp family chaperone for outer membrane proteins
MNELENLINAHNGRLQNLEKELKPLKEMLSDMMDNNEEYTQANEEAKKTAKIKTLAKKKFMSRPESVSLLDKIKDLQYQIKEIKISLSDYLGQYMRENNTNQIPAPDGTFFKIIYSAKLVKGE